MLHHFPKGVWDAVQGLTAMQSASVRFGVEHTSNENGDERRLWAVLCECSFLGGRRREPKKATMPSLDWPSLPRTRV